MYTLLEADGIPAITSPIFLSAAKAELTRGRKSSLAEVSIPRQSRIPHFAREVGNS